MPPSFKTISLTPAGPSGGPELVLLDQRLLPNEVTYVHLRSSDLVAASITSMVIRGAPGIGCAAAYGFYLAAYAASQDGDHPPAASPMPASFTAAMSSAYAVLLASRPTAVNLRYALDRLQLVLDRHASASPAPPLPERAAAVLAEAHAIYDEDVAACRAMGAHGLSLVPRTPGRAARFIHHCNTGSLATSLYGTALGLIRAAHEADPRVFVWVDETRPRLQGARLTAWECVQEGIAHKVMADSCAAVVMAKGEVDMCVVGSDRIAADGSVANKIGTYALAICAKFHDVPFVVVAPTTTVDLRCASGKDIPIEERDASEVSHPCGKGAPAVTPEESSVFNPAFDVTPPELVSFIVTENGIATQGSYAEDLKRLVSMSENKK